MNTPYDNLIGKKIHLEEWDEDIHWFKVDNVMYDVKNGRYELYGVDNICDSTPLFAYGNNIKGLTIIKDFNDHIEEL